MKCETCKRELDVVDKPESMNCGGDCVVCMANAGDEDCIRHLIRDNVENLMDKTMLDHYYEKLEAESL